MRASLRSRKVLVCTLRVVCALSVFAILSLSRANAGAPTHVIPLRGRHGWGPRHLYPECRAVESQLAHVSKLATCAHRKLRDRVFVIVLRIYWPHDKISGQW